MIHLFDDNYLFEFEDLLKYKNFCMSENKIFVKEDFIIGTKGIIYSDYFTIRLLSNNYSKFFKMVSDRQSFEENYNKNWKITNPNIFVGYFHEKLKSMDWSSFKEPNYELYLNTLIGKGSLLKFWFNTAENSETSLYKTYQAWETISLCKDSQFSMSFDVIPSDYLLPIVLKKIK